MKMVNILVSFLPIMLLVMEKGHKMLAAAVDPRWRNGGHEGRLTTGYRATRQDVAQEMEGN